MFPEVNGSGKSINLPAASDLVGVIPGGTVLVIGLKMTELLVENVYNQTIQDMEEEFSEQLEIAKNRGLSEVKKLIGTVGWDKFGFDLIVDAPQKTLNKLLKGEIETVYDLRNVHLSNDKKESDHYPYSILLRTILDANREEYITVVDTVFINHNANN